MGNTIEHSKERRASNVKPSRYMQASEKSRPSIRDAKEGIVGGDRIAKGIRSNEAADMNDGCSNVAEMEV